MTNQRKLRIKKSSTLLSYRPIDLNEFEGGLRTDIKLPLYIDSMANQVTAPFIILKGKMPGPTVGICAAIHGDELNGIKIIHKVLKKLDPSNIRGNIVCAPVANVLAFEAEQRRFPEDDQDLNHVFPGKADGTPSQQYAKAFLTTFITPCDYLIDIHTASEGRVNSFYVRADLHSSAARSLAELMDPEIILHGRSGDGTLRNAARVREIPAITVEAGNPSVFQGAMAIEGEQGVLNILIDLGLIKGDIVRTGKKPVVCKSSRWLRTRSGGLIDTTFNLCQQISKKQRIAVINDPFGYEVTHFDAPTDGIVIGKSRSPVAVPGTRYCHLGIIGEPPPPKTGKERPPS